MSLIVAFSFSFSFFLFFQEENWETLNPNIEDFYSQTAQKPHSKILLIGSSHIGMLNASHINSIVNEQYPDYIVYNLAISSDKPTNRISQTQQIISLNPTIVVYGIGLRDFSNPQFTSNVLPDPKNFVTSYFSENTPQFLENPKLVTLNVLKDNLQYENKPKNLEKNTPFFPYASEYYEITNLDELKQKTNPTLSTKIPNVETNKDLMALEKMFLEFTDNNIQIIVVLTPHNSHFLDNVSDNDKIEFSKIINKISLNNNVNVFSLLTNYSNNNIWVTENHITHSSTGIRFSEDIAKTILLILEE